MKTIFSHLGRQVVLLLCATVMVISPGCIVEPARRVYVEPSPAGAVVVEEDYLYYPDYEVYYNPYTRLYWYSEGGVWVSGPAVPGISVDVLLRSPAVRLNFHEPVALHHPMVVRQYPRGWRPLR